MLRWVQLMWVENHQIIFNLIYKGKERRSLSFDLILAIEFLHIVHAVTPLHHIIKTRMLTLKALNVLNVFFCVVCCRLWYVFFLSLFLVDYIYFLFMSGEWGEGEEDENCKIIASNILLSNHKLKKNWDLYMKTERFKIITTHT
jgi:hypothetical protein